MWFRRKIKNRRLGREYVLDVKLRSSKLRATRARLAAIALAVVFASVLGVYLVYRGANWGLNQLVYENNAFALREIDLQTDGAIPVVQLRRWARVKFGDNLLALDLGRVKRDLEMVSLVQSASLERILPHTLRIRVTEREPLAQIKVLRPRSGGGLEAQLYHIDAEGWVMTPLASEAATRAGETADLLPRLDGVNPAELQAGRRIMLPQVQAALRLISAFSESAMQSLVDLKRIDVSSGDALVVSTGQGSEVVLGLSDFEQQLRRWQAIYELGRSASKAIATMDLAVSNNIPVRWLEASAVPPPSPKSIKPLRTRKKHV